MKKWFIEGYSSLGEYTREELTYSETVESFGVDARPEEQTFWMVTYIDMEEEIGFGNIPPDSAHAGEKLADFAWRFEVLTGINIFTSSHLANKNFKRIEEN